MTIHHRSFTRTRSEQFSGRVSDPWAELFSPVKTPAWRVWAGWLFLAAVCLAFAALAVFAP